jgi:phosphoglycolate phosphatase-like HAD superfamily hydrolase
MSLDIARIRALCFDVDGTLSDTDDQFVQKIERLLTPFKFFFHERNPRPFVRKIVMFTEAPGNFLIGIPDRLRIDDELAAIGDFFFRRGHKKPGSFLLIPGVDEALKKLEAHFPMSVVSARGGRSAQIFLDQFRLSPFFQAIATAQTCEYTKPHPDPIIWAAEQMGVQPSECLMIGDTTVDIRAAKAAGAQSVGVLCGFGKERELREAGADIILEKTSQLPDVLLNKSTLP